MGKHSSFVCPPKSVLRLPVEQDGDRGQGVPDFLAIDDEVLAIGRNIASTAVRSMDRGNFRLERGPEEIHTGRSRCEKQWHSLSPHGRFPASRFWIWLADCLCSNAHCENGL